jgi:hypothetical protein
LLKSTVQTFTKLEDFKNAIEAFFNVKDADRKDADIQVLYTSTRKEIYFVSIPASSLPIPIVGMTMSSSGFGGSKSGNSKIHKRDVFQTQSPDLITPAQSLCSSASVSSSSSRRQNSILAALDYETDPFTKFESPIS